VKSWKEGLPYPYTKVYFKAEGVAGCISPCRCRALIILLVI